VEKSDLQSLASSPPTRPWARNLTLPWGNKLSENYPQNMCAERSPDNEQGGVLARVRKTSSFPSHASAPIAGHGPRRSSPVPKSEEDKQTTAASLLEMSRVISRDEKTTPSPAWLKGVGQRAAEAEGPSSDIVSHPLSVFHDPHMHESHGQAHGALSTTNKHFFRASPLQPFNTPCVKFFPRGPAHVGG
jgi:hypothetical protein